MIPPPPKRRKISGGHKVEEIKFDAQAREEYLNGFHKRKVQRIKQAQALAARKARAEKLEQRKKLRQERREEAQRHVESVNMWLRDAGEDVSDMTSDEGGEWNGFDEEEEEDDDGGGQNEKVDREDEYIDEERYTTVTVEAMDVSRDGLRNVAEGDHSEESNKRGQGRLENGGEQRGSKPDRDEDKTSRPKGSSVKKKKKKKSFRYESKAERKVTKKIQRIARPRKARKH